jgi:hypothetical protein
MAGNAGSGPLEKGILRFARFIVRPKLVTSRLRGPGELATPAEIGSPRNTE